jgi:hypothetical protein
MEGLRQQEEEMEAMAEAEVRAMVQVVALLEGQEEELIEQVLIRAMEVMEPMDG